MQKWKSCTKIIWSKLTRGLTWASYMNQPANNGQDKIKRMKKRKNSSTTTLNHLNLQTFRSHRRLSQASRTIRRLPSKSFATTTPPKWSDKFLKVDGENVSALGTVGSAPLWAFFREIIGFCVVAFEVSLTNRAYSRTRYLSAVLIKPYVHVGAEKVQHFLSVYERKPELLLETEWKKKKKNKECAEVIITSILTLQGPPTSPASFNEITF